MNTVTPLTICGAPTSGKSVVAALLDGTKYINCTLSLIFHDNLSALFTMLQAYLDDASSRLAQKFGEDKLLFFVRKLLIDHSAYYISLPWAFDLQRINYFFSSTQIIRRPVPTMIPFLKLDSLIMSRIQELDDKRPGKIFTLFQKTILENIKSYKQFNYQFYTSITVSDFNNYQQILSSYNNSKIIYIDRELNESIGSTFLRESKTLNKPFIETIHRMDSEETRAWIRRIHDNRRIIMEIQRSLPCSVCIIDFQELMHKPKDVMYRVANFLQIPFDRRFLQPSFMGVPFNIDGYFTVQDDIQRLLSTDELSALQRFIDKALAVGPQNEA